MVSVSVRSSSARRGLNPVGRQNALHTTTKLVVFKTRRVIVSVSLQDLLAEFVIPVISLLIERVFDYFQPAQLIVEKLRGLPSLIGFGHIATQIVALCWPIALYSTRVIEVSAKVVFVKNDSAYRR